MKNYSYSIDLTKVCRLCFVEKTELSHIFDNKNIPDLSLKIKECVSIEISNDDDSPNQICDDCYKEVNNWINFKQKCSEADSNLKSYLQNSQVKEESGEDVESAIENSCSPYIQTIYILNPNSKDNQSDTTDIIDNAEDPKEISIKSEPVAMKELIKKKKIRSYYKPQIYPCEICLKTFTRACDLLNHDYKDHDDIPRNINCDICGKLVISEDRLLLHKQKFHTKKSFPCAVCQKKYISSKSLNRHYSLHYQKFICDYCQKCFQSKHTLLTHIRKHIQVESFVCDKCDKSFGSKVGLQTHERTHSAMKLFKCDKCDFAAKHQSGIYIHMISRHSANESIICELCGKTFKNKMRLNEHLKRKHQTPKRFACDKCDYKFKQMYQLRVHYRTHTGERPFVCEICGKGYSRSDGLKEHKRNHHNIVVY